MKPLTDAEKMFVREMRNNPNFASICEKIEAHKRVPSFKPGADEEARSARWKYDSGWVDGVAFTLNVIGYKHE